MHRPAIEPRKTYHPGCRHSSECGRPYARARYLRAPGRSGVVTDPGMCRRFLYGNREVPRPTGCAHNVRCSGPHREGEEPKPMMHDRGKSDSAIVAVKPTNNAGQPAAEPVEPRAGTKRNAGEQSTHRTQGRARVTQALARVRKAAQQRRKEKFTALFHHLSVDLLREAFLVLKRDAAPGMDGRTWQAYAADLERNLTDLHARVHRGAYRATPSRRTYIPKADGRQRPLAVAALEDKIVQRATVAVLNCIYEEEFLGFSYGFRPKRGQHDALDALAVGITDKKVNFILDADVRSFFDEVSQSWLIRFVEHRIADPRIIRLIQKWLKAGVLEDGVVTVSEKGTGQGSVITPRTQKITSAVLAIWLAGMRGWAAFGRSVGEGDRMADHDLIITHKDLFDQQAHDLLAIEDVESMQRSPEPAEECGECFGETEIGSAVGRLIGDRLQFAARGLFTLA